MSKWVKTSSHHMSFQHGYKMRFETAKAHVTGDSVGSCNADENFTSSLNLCIEGYDPEYEPGGRK
jgi:hypothetical protein